MPRQIVENTVTRGFDLSKFSLLQNILDYIEEKNEVIEDDDGKPPNANSGDLL